MLQSTKPGLHYIKCNDYTYKEPHLCSLELLSTWLRPVVQIQLDLGRPADHYPHRSLAHVSSMGRVKSKISRHQMYQRVKSMGVVQLHKIKIRSRHTFEKKETCCFIQKHVEGVRFYGYMKHFTQLWLEIIIITLCQNESLNVISSGSGGKQNLTV